MPRLKPGASASRRSIPGRRRGRRCFQISRSVMKMQKSQKKSPANICRSITSASSGTMISMDRIGVKRRATRPIRPAPARSRKSGSRPPVKASCKARPGERRHRSSKNGRGARKKPGNYVLRWPSPMPGYPLIWYAAACSSSAKK